MTACIDITAEENKKRRIGHKICKKAAILGYGEAKLMQI
jgi:hypothetical protein